MAFIQRGLTLLFVEFLMDNSIVKKTTWDKGMFLCSQKTVSAFMY